MNYDNDRLIPNDSCAANAAEEHATQGAGDYNTTGGAGVGALRREIKYSGLEAAAAARKQRETSPNARDSVKSRYSSDPCKVLGNAPGSGGAENHHHHHQPMIPEENSDQLNDQLDGDFLPVPASLPPAPPTPMGGPKEGQLFSKGQRLPVDEDDYLTPKSSNPKAYIDLVDGKWNNMCSTAGLHYCNLTILLQTLSLNYILGDCIKLVNCAETQKNNSYYSIVKLY